MTHQCAKIRYYGQSQSALTMHQAKPPAKSNNMDINSQSPAEEPTRPSRPTMASNALMRSALPIPQLPQLRMIAVSSLARLLPPFVANRLRTYALRAAGIQIETSSIFWGMPTLLGEKLAENLTIGAACGFNVGCLLDVGAPIRIGNHVSIGHHVMILSRTFNIGTAQQRAGDLYEAAVTIEDGAWIGARCTIMPGVTIGAGAIVGATMVIDKDVPPNVLLLGKQKLSLAKWRS